MKSERKNSTEIRDLNMDELKAECKTANLPVGGDKAELAKRVRVNRLGSTKFTGGGAVKCQVCSMPARVNKVVRKEMGDGRILVTRQIKCTGRHGHTYPLSEIVKPDK